MDTYSDNGKRLQFQTILFELAHSQELLKDNVARGSIYQKLEKLYYSETEQQFRHYYSDIFSVLTQIENNSELGDIDILGQNLDVIREGYQPKTKDKDGNLIDISTSIKKLYDHVNMEIARISYSKAQDRNLLNEDKLSELQAEITKISCDLELKRKEVGEIQNKLEKSQKEYIAILGIFSAVVLSFVGGLAFSTSVLENLHLASIYRTVFVCSLISLTLIDVIYLMFRYINKIVHGTKNKACWRQHIPIILANAVVLCIMLSTVVAWKLGCAEHRNIDIEREIKFEQINQTK